MRKDIKSGAGGPMLGKSVNVIQERQAIFAGHFPLAYLGKINYEFKYPNIFIPLRVH